MTPYFGGIDVICALHSAVLTVKMVLCRQQPGQRKHEDQR